MASQETLKIFDELYYETYQDILKYVVCNCSNIDNVKDIVQNIYLEVLKKIKKNSEIQLTKAYIMGIAKHKLKDYYRFNYKAKIISLNTSKNKDELELINNIPKDFNLDEYIITKEDIKLIWSYLKKKKVIISQIFYLYYYLDYSILEIAKELNISASNVKNYLYRTLKELNLLLESRGN